MHGNHDLLHEQGRYADGHEHDGYDARLLGNVHDVREYDAMACEQMSGDQMMMDCAMACRKCAEACRSMQMMPA